VDTSQADAKSSSAPEKPGSSGTRLDGDPSAPTFALLLRAGARVFAVVRAFLFSSKRKLGVALFATELVSQFWQQKWQFRVPGEIGGPPELPRRYSTKWI
jgi:hypothetical protein